jgi:hypothetical protein
VAYSTAETREIAAPADKVWEMVSDLARMGDWSPENIGGKWTKGASGPALGAMFEGMNKKGFRRWSTTATVVAFEPGRLFEFAVTSGPMAIANWRYEFESTASGCRVTESWQDRRSRFMKLMGRVVGKHDAPQAQRQMSLTLANLAAAAQS